MSEHILKLENIRKVYGNKYNKFEALKNISLEIKQGEFCMITGPSGCGKSTLLNLIGLLDIPTSGQITIDNVNVTNLNDKKRTIMRNQKIGFIFQFANLIPELTVLENIMLPRLILGHNKKNVRDESIKLLEKVDLNDFMSYESSKLSGGQMQRVAIARGLINNPAIVLADEPTGNLDSKNAKLIIELLHKLNKENKQTFVLVTHAPRQAGKVDKIIKMKDGKISNKIS
tara:strand:- start:302 stop:988 length:687 start_codon:yes stop_codon:yes gene_type:complete